MKQDSIAPGETSVKLSDKEIALLAAYAAHVERGNKKTIRDVKRRSAKEFDLEISGRECNADGDLVCLYSAWFPLGAIGWLTKWDCPEIASMCDFGNVEAGWSAIRDSNVDAIWAIFNRFVKPMTP